MSCDSRQGNQLSNIAPARPFDALFEQYWPAAQPFPPMTPWIAAVVTRSQARAWAIAVGGERDTEATAGNPLAMLDLVGRAMLGGEEYAKERKRKKKKAEQPDIPDGTACFDRTCDGTMPPVTQRCCPTEDLTTFWCAPACPSGLADSGDDMPAATTEGPQ